MKNVKLLSAERFSVTAAGDVDVLGDGVPERTHEDVPQVGVCWSLFGGNANKNSDE